ncbi:MAG: helix-turn-helix domain-containing protein [Paenibacillaceae bacterium]|nr:helix-turn-helix domain-containing protein [Paenibacillaceae bacterium]
MLLKNNKKRNFYKKLIVYTLLISLLPIFAMSFFFYYNAKDSMQKELQAANVNYLQQTVNAMEVVSKQISNSFRQLSFDRVLRDYEGFPRGAHYEALNGVYNEDELPGLYSYLSAKQRLVSALDVLKDSNEFIYSIYYYDSAKEMILDTKGGQYSPEQFYDPEWQSFVGKIKGVPSFTEPRNARQNDGSFKEVIPMVYISPVIGNYLVINLNTDALYSSFVSPLNNQLGGAFFILSAEGKRMLFDKSNRLNELIGSDADVTERIRTAAMPSFVEEFDGRRMLVTAIASEKLGWTFVTATTLNELYRSVVNMRTITLFTCLLLMIATGLLALATTRNIYHPVSRLLHYIRSKDPSIPKPETDLQEPGEFGLIHSSFERVYQDRTNLQLRLKESMPANQEKFVRALLHHHSMDTSEIEERLKFLSLDIELDGLFLLLVSLEESRSKGLAMEAEKLMKLRIMDIVEEQLPADRKRIVMEMAEDQVVVIVSAPAHELEEQFAIAGRMIEQIQLDFGFTCSVGIGKYCPDVTALKRAYEEAQEALRYRTVAGASEVIYIDDVRLEGTPLLLYPKEKEMALINYMINGETGRAHGVFGEMIQDLRSQRALVHPHQVQHAFVQLLSGFIAAAGELRVDLNRLMQVERNLYSILMQKKDWAEIVSWFEMMIGRLSVQIGDAFREKNNRHIDQIVRILDQSYGEQITLAAVAERLGMHQTYVSRIFKEKTGETFTEYLTRLRIDKSKKLLLESKLTVTTISEQVGYLKPSYFMKLFKTYTGVSPGEYRRLHGEDSPQEE